MAVDSTHLIWVDLEMTGLEPERDRIIEIATIVTNAALEVVEEGPVLAVHQGDQILAAMDAWNKEHHAKSGLADRVRRSRCSEREAERLTLEFLERHVPPQCSPMCGNSICQDRRFMARHMPELERYFHYRHIDVSTLKELCSRWAPEIAKGFHKETTHRALQDIKDSINELRYYRTHFLRA